MNNILINDVSHLRFKEKLIYSLYRIRILILFARLRFVNSGFFRGFANNYLLVVVNVHFSYKKRMEWKVFSVKVCNLKILIGSPLSRPSMSLAI